MCYVKCVICILSMLCISAILGFSYVIYKSGFKAQMKMYSSQNDQWYDCYDQEGNLLRNYDILFLSLSVILCSLIAPLLLRPLDFLQNPGRYLFGLVMYICMLPVYVAVIPIYSICNTHDISRGTR